MHYTQWTAHKRATTTPFVAVVICNFPFQSRPGNRLTNRVTKQLSKYASGQTATASIAVRGKQCNNLVNSSSNLSNSNNKSAIAANNSRSQNRIAINECLAEAVVARWRVGNSFTRCTAMPRPSQLSWQLFSEKCVRVCVCVSALTTLAWYTSALPVTNQRYVLLHALTTTTHLSTIALPKCLCELPALVHSPPTVCFQYFVQLFWFSYLPFPFICLTARCQHFSILLAVTSHALIYPQLCVEHRFS